MRKRAEAQEDEKFLSGDESGAAKGRQCFDPQVSSVHPIGVSVSNAGLAITHCLGVAARYSAFLSFSPCNTNVHLVFFGATAHGGCPLFSSSPEELKCAVRLSLNTGSTFGNLTPLPASVRLETLWRSWRQGWWPFQADTNEVCLLPLRLDEQVAGFRHRHRVFLRISLV